MDLPEVVREALNDESVAAKVALGGKDLLLVTPSRTLVYRGEGLLSDESVTEFPHGAERIELKRGRRKSTVVLDYGLDGERRLDLPTNRIEDALHPVLAGVLNGAGITESGEAVKETFLFSELTVVITSERVVWHIGETVWDGEFEQHRYDDVVDLRFEEGDVATSVVIRLESGQERFKVPNDRARAVREQLVDALLAHHGYETLGAFREARTPDDADERTGTVDFGAGPDPLTADPPSGGRKSYDDVVSESGRDAPPGAAVDRVDTDAGTDTAAEHRGSAAAMRSDAPPDDADEGDADGESDVDEESDVDGEREMSTDSDADSEPRSASDSTSGSFVGSGFESAGPVDDGDLAAEVAALREAVEAGNELLREHDERLDRQGERLDRQSDLFEQLIDELRRGR